MGSSGDWGDGANEVSAITPKIKTEGEQEARPIPPRKATFRTTFPALAAALVLALASCTKTSPVPQQPGDDSSSRTTTAFNAPSTPAEMAAKCDVPIYPGAQAPDDLSRMPRTDTDGNSHLELVLTSKDPIKKVADYYSKALKLPASKSDDSLSIVGKSPHNNEIILQIVREGGQTVIRIHSIAHKST